MPRKQHTYHYIYKTVCIVSGKYYIGMHSTSNLEDGYFGSGKVLKRSINKYGKENHKFEILEYLEDRSSLKEREKELVNESLLQDPMCMNLKIGGEGGFNKEDQILGAKATHKIIWDKDSEFRKKHSERLSKLSKERWNQEKYKKIFLSRTGFLNKKHSEESKKQIGDSISIKQKGEYNSQFGKCWITNGNENKKIQKGDEIPEGWSLGRVIIKK